MSVENTETHKPAPITFTDEQVEKVNVIVADAMSRAAVETRKKLSAAEKELAELKAKATTEPIDSDVALELAKSQAAASNRTAAALKKELIESKKEVLLTQLGSAHRFVDTAVVSKIAADSLKWNEDKRRFDVVNPDGTPKLDRKTFEPMRPDTFIAAFAEEHPYLVAPNDNRAANNPNSYQPEQIFGKKSSSKLANDLAKRNPQEYKRLKALAKEQGII